MLADGHQYFAGHMAALLGARSLVLNVNPSGTLLDEELGQLHNGRQTAVTSIGIGDDGSEVVDVGELGALGLRCRQTLLTLLSVVEELCHEQMRYLVWDSGLFLWVSN